MLKNFDNFERSELAC